MHDTMEPHKMNRTLAIEPLSGTFSPTEAPPGISAMPTSYTVRSRTGKRRSTGSLVIMEA
jgi:hypothetical protein